MGSKNKNRSSIKDHSLVAKKLVAPFNTLPVPLTFASWGEDRLGELIWAALVVSQLPRVIALQAFGQLASLGGPYRNFPPEILAKKFDLSITGLSVNAEPLLEQVVHVLTSYSLSSHLLRPLLLLDCIPQKPRWRAAIGQDAEFSDWGLLEAAVGSCFNHQSQGATDLRWLTVFFETALGRIHLPYTEEGKRWRETLIRYPECSEEELKSARPFVRSTEGAIRTEKYCKTKFTGELWPELFVKTDCTLIQIKSAPLMSRLSVHHISLVREAVTVRYSASLKSSSPDTKADAVFGAALYGLRCIAELSDSDALRQGVAGRALLRTILELRINLAYLLKLDSDELWGAFRKYGASQAKLALLKLDAAEGTLPSFLNEETLEAIASEDLYHEFLDIPLGSWSGGDLRKLSDKSGSKEDYDKFYGWASTFVHGHWCAMRDSEFTTCLNPLHRFHRVVRPASRALEDSLPDAVHLLNEILTQVECAYPGGLPRLSMS